MELVINAIKFSTWGSTVGIYSGVHDGYFSIGIKNEVQSEPFMGIPDGMESLLVEPFFRAHVPVEDYIQYEKFTMGLGLTAVDFIVRQHNGVFFINNAKDHLGLKPVDCVVSRILLPIVEQDHA
jgi:K+-sensing histidine kinase KdpD